MAFKGQIPDELVRAILDHKSMAFVGAGLSMSCKRSNGSMLPAWGGLLNEMLTYAKNNRVPLKDVESDLKNALGKENFLLVAQELSERMGGELFRSFLRSVFLDTALRPSPSHKNLVKIPFSAFLTTNYDTLIEGAHTLNNGGRIPPILTQEDLDKIPNPLKLQDTFVFKIHGDINRPETIILTSHDYQETLFRRPAYRSFLETLFTTNTGLFLGFGLGDQDVDYMLDRLASIFSRNNDTHFALVEKGKLSQLEIKRLALDKRIRVIEYENRDGRHSQVNAFLQSLSKITNPETAVYQEYEEKILSEKFKSYRKQKPKNSVFISYSSKDKNSANQIAQKLIENGIDVWLDDWSIKVGDSLVSKINEGIKYSKYMVVLLSKNYIESQWSQKELQSAMIKEAEQKRAYILPIVMEKGVINKLPAFLQDRLYLDFSNDIDSGIQALIKRIYSQN